MHTSPLCPKGFRLIGLIQLKVNSNLKTQFIAFNNSQTLLMPSTTFFQASLAKKKFFVKEALSFVSQLFVIHMHLGGVTEKKTHTKYLGVLKTKFMTLTNGTLRQNKELLKNLARLISIYIKVNRSVYIANRTY